MTLPHRTIDLLAGKTPLRLLVADAPAQRKPDETPRRLPIEEVPAPLPGTGLVTRLSGSAKVPCSTCHLRESCLPAGLTEGEIEQIDDGLVTALRKVARGEPLFRAGSRFDAVFQVWTGVFKTVSNSHEGREQVTGFHISGDLMGIDGISTGRHSVDGIALEASQVCVIPYDALEKLGREVPPLQQQFHRFMSREIVNDHSAMLQLGSMYAEERVAAFLIDLTDRLRRRGFSASSVLLRMTREEIGSYLGLKLETVSRAFSKLQASGLLFVRQRQIQITDPVGLQQLLEGVAA